MEKTTITISSLASVIGLFLIRMVMKSKGFKFSFSSRLIKLNARVGHASPETTISVEDEPQRYSHSRKRSQSAPVPLTIIRSPSI